MANVTVKLNLPALNRLMSSAPVQAKVDEVGQRIAANAGEEFEYVARPHRWTARGYVQPRSARGARQQARDAVLERALGSVVDS